MTAVPPGMTGFDPDGLNALATSLGSAQHDIDDAAARLRRALESLGLPVAPTGALREVSKWISEAKPAIERRRDLAFAATPLIRDPHNRTVNIKNDTIDLFATQHDADTTARRIAADLRAYAPGDPSHSPDCRFLDDLRAYAADPSFASALISQFKPEELRALPLLLAQRLRTLESQATIRDRDQFGPVGKEHDEIIAALGTALATATRTSGGLPSGYQEALLGHLDDPVNAFGLGNLLRSGTYDTAFLTEATKTITKLDHKNDPAHWVALRASYASAGDYGFTAEIRGSSYTDPMVGLMDALGHNPVAAQQFINKDNLTYLIHDRQWPDGGQALGNALVAATTAFRDHAPDAHGKHSRGYTSAQLASQALELIEKSQDGFHTGFRQPTARILAAYAPDTVKAIRVGDVGDPGVSESSTSGHRDALPYGVVLNQDNLTDLLTESFKDPESFKILVSSITDHDLADIRADAHAIGAQLHASHQSPDDAVAMALQSATGRHFQTACKSLAIDIGFLTRAQCQTQIDAGAEQDKAAQETTDMLSALSGLAVVPLLKVGTPRLFGIAARSVHVDLPEGFSEFTDAAVDTAKEKTFGSNTFSAKDEAAAASDQIARKGQNSIFGLVMLTLAGEGVLGTPTAPTSAHPSQALEKEDYTRLLGEHGLVPENLMTKDQHSAFSAWVTSPKVDGVFGAIHTDMNSEYKNQFPFF
ncbi:MAG: hypothetical protein JWO79_4590 [Actinomycetia bacterium]|nr:hypothetical protein [Actinomycetes bacterium]